MTKTRLPMVGVFIPSCDDDGSYTRKQCHGSTGYCWCADKHGKKFQETSVRGEPDCKGIVDSPLHLQKSGLMMTKSLFMIINGFSDPKLYSPPYFGHF